MESMNLQKFNFDFNLTYKELKSKTLKNRDTHTGIYHYLQTIDRFHDVIEKTIIYFEKREMIEQNDFISIFWTAWRFSTLQNYRNTNPKSQELIKTTYVDGFENEGNLYGINYQPDLDQQELIKKIRNCPTVNIIMEGYSIKEAGEMVGITREGYNKRFRKELKKIML